MSIKSSLSLMLAAIVLLVDLGCAASPRAAEAQGVGERGCDFERSLRSRIAERRETGLARSKARLAGLAGTVGPAGAGAGVGTGVGAGAGAGAGAGGVAGRVADASAWLPARGSGSAGKPSATEMTRALNAAFGAKVDLLVVPDLGYPWTMDKPLYVDGPAEILLAPGSEITTAEGAFKAKGDCLLTVRSARLKRISGYGARLSMRGDDYRGPGYGRSQWRHGLALFETVDLTVEGLEVRDTGGDGIYVGQERGAPPNRNLSLLDLRLEANHRQGISVIAADGFLMDGCVAARTRGTAPQAGIDFEPNAGTWGFERCVVRSCILEGNSGAALSVHPVKLGGEGRPIDIRVETSLVSGAPLALWARGMGGGVKGRLEIVDSVVRGLRSIQKTRDFRVEFR